MPAVEPMESVLIAHAAVTWFMAGVISVVHLVHYPSFRVVGVGSFVAYHHAHTRRISTIVVPAMLAELVLSVWLLLPSSTVSPLLAWSGAVALAGIWGMTVLVHVPQHTKLATGLQPDIVEALIRTNLVRTLLWLTRAVLAALILLS